MIATVRRPPAGGGAVGESASAATHGAQRVALQPQRRVVADAAVEDGEHLARELLVAVAEDRGEDLVPALGRATPAGSSATSARISAQRLRGRRGEAGADVLGRRAAGPLARARGAPACALITDDVQLRPLLEPEARRGPAKYSSTAVRQPDHLL